jgi:hypothetical protein
MKSIISLLCCCLLALFTLAIVPAVYAQEQLSGMTGTVTDQSGAAIPDATVTLTNTTTGLKYTQATTATGLYHFANIPPGAGYEATFSAKGFNPLEVKDIYLIVSAVRTQNASLTVSAHQEVVEVSASNAEVTVDTTDAQVGNTFDVQQLNNLPVQQREDPTALFTMQPGVTQSGAVTGARVDQNNVTLDGLDVNDFETGGATQTNSGSGVTEGFGSDSIVGHAPVDSVEEFTGNVAGSLASTGPSSGGQFALVTKSGTNQFHGNLNEYHRDPDLVANSWFSNNANPIVPRNHLIQNQFGGNIGGPVKHDKLFFFFDFLDSKIISDILTQRTVPLNTLRGDNSGGPEIGYINANQTTSYLSASQVQALDPAGIGIDSTWLSAITKRFPKSNNNVTGDGVNSGGYSFNAPNNDDLTNYVGRGDWNINDKQKMFARFTIARENAVEFPNEFAGDPATDPFIDRSYGFVIGDNWIIGDNKTNRVILGETVQKFAFPNSYNPEGNVFFTFSDGTGPALASSLYLNPAASARRIPIPMVGDDFTLTKGNHIWQMGGTFKDILTHTTSVIDYNAVELGPGGYTLSLCGPNPGDCASGSTNAGPTSTLRPSGIYQAPSNATPAQAAEANLAEYDWDQAFLFMLAHVGEVSSDYNYNLKGQSLPQLTGDQRMDRYYQMQLYAMDSWKILPSLTLTYGLTYQWFSVPYETRGLESTEPFTLQQYMQARIQQSAASQTGATAVPLIAYYLGGKGNGSSAPGIYKPEYRNMAPHVGFAWNPGFDKKSVFNAGAGIVYDRTIIGAVQATQDTDSYLFQQSAPFPQGIAGDPWDSVSTGPRLDKNNGISTVAYAPPATPVAPYEPFTAGGTPYGLEIGSAFNATIDPALKTPYEITFNAGWQRNLPGDMVIKASYVGRMGRRLLAQTDANQVLDFPDPVSGQTLAQAFGNVTQQLRAGATASTVVPQPWFENVIAPNAGLPAGETYTSFLVANFGPFVQRGDFGDSVQFFSDTGAPLNVGSAAQFSENTFYSNGGFSTYHGLLFTLSKNASHGLHYDFNYTYSHSIDNVSFFANSAGDTGIGGIGLVCDYVRPRECRASSDFDVRHYINSDATYELPFGKGKAFGGTAPVLLNEFIGGWSLSGLASFHTGFPWSDDANAFVASYSNDAPGLIIGPRKYLATSIDKLPGGGVSNFASQANAQAAFEGPIGFSIGPRNALRGAHFFNLDTGLGKTFPITSERVNLNFRADAFNVLNHPNFDLPSENVYNGLDEQDFTNSTFGQISYTVVPPGNLNNGARVLQLSLRLEF